MTLFPGGFPQSEDVARIRGECAGIWAPPGHDQGAVRGAGDREPAGEQGGGAPAQPGLPGNMLANQTC